jgi:hypothetical protein
VPFNGCGDWICTRPDHWIFAGTGMKRGDRIPGLVGWEYHGEPADIPGLEIVGEGTVLSVQYAPAAARPLGNPLTLDGDDLSRAEEKHCLQWLLPSGGRKVSAMPPGHMLPWSHGSRPHGPDERVSRITRNLLQRALGAG